MSSIKARSRKRAYADVSEIRNKDLEAAESLERMGREMLKACKELYIEPETALFELYYLTGVVERALMAKHQIQMSRKSRDPFGKKEHKELRKDFLRVKGAMIAQSLDEPRGQSATKGRKAVGDPKSTSSIGITRKNESAPTSGDKRPIYIQ